jgi:hypothetical protein
LRPRHSRGSHEEPDRGFRIDLTNQQKEQIKSTTGRAAEAIELTIQELEERIAPKLAANHNETLLVDRT